MRQISLFLILGVLASQTLAYTDSNCGEKQVIVHLFEWSHADVARECETFLGPAGFCGVQVSPVNEHIQGGQWWTRYQPVSYKLQSRSGTEAEFKDMVNRCNAAGVKVIADVVFNHMSGPGSGTGTAGSSYDHGSEQYPGVPFGPTDFHQPSCEINNYNDQYNVRFCNLVGLRDLDGGKEYVRQKIADFMTNLINLGVKGFRVDAAKHMWPGDMAAIIDRLPDVDGKRPLMIHEVIDQGGEAISMTEYFELGKVTEFKASTNVFPCVRNGIDFGCLQNYPNGMSDGYGLVALTFVDNHDNQRNHGGGGNIVTYKDSYDYKLATGFHLAHPYAFKRVMSSYDFTDTDAGPPGSGPAAWPNTCGNGWICEHRWSPIYGMVQFANKMTGEGIENWQVKDGTLGFSRGAKGFFAMGNLNNVQFYTGMPDGEYCDLIHNCGRKITVSGGNVVLNKEEETDGLVAFCVDCNGIEF